MRDSSYLVVRISPARGIRDTRYQIREDNASRRHYEREPDVRNKPNWPGGRDIPVFHYSIIPAFHPVPDVRNEACAKESWCNSAGWNPARPKDSRPAGMNVGVSGGNEWCEALRAADGQPQRK